MLGRCHLACSPSTTILTLKHKYQLSATTNKFPNRSPVFVLRLFVSLSAPEHNFPSSNPPCSDSNRLVARRISFSCLCCFPSLSSSFSVALQFVAFPLIPLSLSRFRLCLVFSFLACVFSSHLHFPLQKIQITYVRPCLSLSLLSP